MKNCNDLIWVISGRAFSFFHFLSFSLTILLSFHLFPLTYVKWCMHHNQHTDTYSSEIRCKSFAIWMEMEIINGEMWQLFAVECEIDARQRTRQPLILYRFECIRTRERFSYRRFHMSKSLLLVWDSLPHGVAMGKRCEAHEMQQINITHHIVHTCMECVLCMCAI